LSRVLVENISDLQQQTLLPPYVESILYGEPIAIPHTIETNCMVLLLGIQPTHVQRTTVQFYDYLKKQCHEIFDPRFFSLNCTPGSPDTWAKTVLHIGSNSRSYSTTKIDSALCRIARSHESGDQGYSLMKKTEGRKSRDTVSLTILMS
jgi:hypothetical protein